MDAETNTTGGILRVMERRVSCRSFRPDSVDEKILHEVVEAARLAPSACNRQPWRLAVVRNDGLKKRIVEEGFLPGLHMEWALQAPVLIILGMERAIVTHVLGVAVSGIDYPWIDIGIAGEHIVLAAAERRLGTCWIGWIRAVALRRVVGWKRSIRPAAVIALGYPSPENVRPPPAARRMPAERFVTWW